MGDARAGGESTPRGWSASRDARGTGRSPGPSSAGTRRQGRRLGRRLLAAFGRDRFRVELQRPYWRRDRARNRWLACLAERLGVAGRRHRQRPLARPRRAPTCRTRWSRSAWGDVGGVRAAAARQLELGAGLARGDGRALRRAPRCGRRDPAHRRAARSSTSPRARLPLPRREDEPGADARAGRALPRAAGRALRRRPAPRRRPRSRLEEELETIRALGLSGFFLLHHDLLELAREVAVEVRGPDSARAVLPPGRGRGSSVSSIVCYLTGLSHIDPVEADLFSGRFLNERERPTMPDIDLDFPRDIREVLIPRVHERYGARALGAGRRLPHLPPARRRARPRQGARAAAGGDRQGGEDGRLPRAQRRDREGRGRRARARARRRQTLAGAAASSARRRWACPAMPPSIPAAW